MHFESVNYKPANEDSFLLKPRRRNARVGSNNTGSSNASTRSRSNSNSSVESLSTFNYKKTSKYTTRSGRVSAKNRGGNSDDEEAPAAALPMRSSTRLRGVSAQENKKISYAEEQDSDASDWSIYYMICFSFSIEKFYSEI